MKENSSSSESDDPADQMQKSRRVVDQNNLCPLCERSFSMFRPKHKCKKCLRKVCDECSKSRMRFVPNPNETSTKTKKGLRYCDFCATSHVQKLQLLLKKQTPPPHQTKKLHTNNKQTPKKKYRTETQTANQKQQIHLLDYHRYFFLTILLSLVLICRFLFGSAKILSYVVPFPHLYHTITLMHCYMGVIFICLVFDEFYLIIRRKTSTKADVQKTDDIPANNETVESLEPAEIKQAEVVDEDDIKVDTGDIKPKKFSIHTLFTALNQAVSEDKDIRMSSFLSCCEQIASFIGSIGKSTSFAASTVSGYLQSIDKNLSRWDRESQHDQKWTERPMDDIFDQEILTGVATIGGKKNPSSSRCVVRLIWFLDFVELFLRYCFVENQTEDLGSPACRSYEETIGARHPWIIRKGVSSAFCALPYKKTLLTKLYHLHNKQSENLDPQYQIEDETEEEGIEKLLKMVEKVVLDLSCFKNHIQASLEKRQLTQIK